MSPEGPRFPSVRGSRFLLAAILVAGLALRAWMAWLNEFPTVDGTMYLEEAYQLTYHGRLPFSCFPPGWPLLAAAPLRFFAADDPMGKLRAAQIANVLLGTAALGLTFALLRRQLGAVLALAGVVLMAALPQNIVLAKGDLSEPAFTCGLLAGWLLFRRDRPGAAGLVLGYTYLIRPEALLATVGLSLHLAWRNRRIPWRLPAGHLALMIPYLIYIRAATGAWDVSSKTVALSQSLAAHPGLDYLGLIAANLKLLLPMAPGLLGWPLVVLALWGLARGRGAWLWMLAPLAPVPFIINPMVDRFWLPYVPFLLLGAGLGARDLVGMAARRLPAGNRRALVAALAVVAAAGFVQASWDDAFLVRRNTEAFYGLKDAGLWLRGRVTPDTVVASYKPYPAYWAGCTFLKFPEFDTAGQYVAWARNHGVDYLVVNVLVVHRHRPGLDALLESPLRPSLAADLTLVNLISFEQTEHTTAIYQVRR